MEENGYKVYIRVDEKDRVVEINSSAFIDDLTGWIVIDSGESMRYHHAQGNYLPKPLTDENGAHNFKWEAAEIRECSEEEKAAELAARPPAPPTLAELMTNAAISAQFSHCRWDGVKYIAEPDNPIPLVLPMHVIRNMIYLYNGVRYVALKDGTAAENLFGEFFAEY